MNLDLVLHNGRLLDLAKLALHLGGLVEVDFSEWAHGLAVANTIHPQGDAKALAKRSIRRRGTAWREADSLRLLLPASIRVLFVQQLLRIFIAARRRPP